MNFAAYLESAARGGRITWNTLYNHKKNLLGGFRVVACVQAHRRDYFTKRTELRTCLTIDAEFGRLTTD